MAEPNGAPQGKPIEDKPAEATESSAAAMTARPLARDLYDWASRLASEAGGEVEDHYLHPENYYWTPQMERLVTKLKLTKRALIGVVGVQGVGKTTTMRAIQTKLVDGAFPRDQVIAVKVPESGGLTTALKVAFNPPGAGYSRFEARLGEVMADRLYNNSILQQRVRSRARRAGDSGLAEEVEKIDASFDETDVMKLRTVIPQRIVRELESEALRRLLESQRVIMIDMPDYPKHDRRLIARDLDDIQNLWNRLMASDKDVSLMIFIQKETFNHADHFLYGKMDLIDLLPLTTSQLLEAYSRKWSGYAPFTEEALQYVAKMSRGVFRRFKRYIALALEMRIAEQVQVDASSAPIDLEVVKKSVTDEEVMRDMDKELDGIFRKPEQKRKALELIRILTDMSFQREQIEATHVRSLSELTAPAGEPPPAGLQQCEFAGKLDLSEMAVSRLVRELEQHGYVKRMAWQHWKFIVMNW